ncbi:MAG: potassium transporter TrkA [Flavobacteriales bacterium CG03_land_8_20_14_0_80_35_15]|nr:MAG: potassium transporter TrkA [Flavobacteriales bacterium CG11_big_fil_rev_8_21_14_0_20_35_7]PIV17579.1 MAG: potassium transporter TrkA [Flavobacteriales bacterium CG03_land_8_20_14_0_80_35_15]PIX07053.1 MAG: potassium transporter TrkA [Flavobacteriales bacterium CG_4_8_14_3_um_filter_35_10]
MNTLDYYKLVKLLIGFLIVAIASYQIAKVFQKIKFPLVTGLIITGIISGTSLLNFIKLETLQDLHFLNDLALSIIAFSAGSELYLDDLRSRIKSIKWMVLCQLFITFIISSVVIYFVADQIPFMIALNSPTKVGISILFATIFVARSPSSVIAVINEMRANGPFTKTVMGVTVVKDVLVIVVFAICLSLAKTLIKGDEVNILFLLILFLELLISISFGYFFGKILQIPFILKTNPRIKSALILAIGYSIYLFTNFIKSNSLIWFKHQVVLEPLLIAIIAGFVLTNYSKHRIEFSELLHKIGPSIYIIFFTLTGASLDINMLFNVFGIALSLFILRLLTLMIAGGLGVYAAKDNKKYALIAWMPYVTQAGVALGLATIVSQEFPDWGYQFETIIIAIIIIGQLFGDLLFKFALNYINESHLKAKNSEADITRTAIIFGIENQSIALAHQLIKNYWKVKMVTSIADLVTKYDDLDIIVVNSLSRPDLSILNLAQTETAILMLDDKRNFELATLIFEQFGTKEIVVRLNNREYFDKFNELGAKIIDPSTAIVSLLDHFVRSPNATNLLLGIDKGQDSIDIEIRNKDVAGLRLRDLRMPSDIIVLSLKRHDQFIISHGYTQLRLGDVVTMVGSHNSLEALKIKFDN